jgi:uncharacterized protein YdaU (DUF1376 family)
MEGVSMMYAKFFPSDWRTGCLTLTLEEEGLYIRVCAYMYDTGKPLPDKDREASQLLRVQVQKYEKVMKSLIAKGKMIRAQGFIINERVQEEWHRYMMMMANRAEAAKKREATRKRLAEEVEKAILEQRAAGGPPLGTPQATPPPTPLGTPPTSVEGTPQGEGKLANKINERRAQTEHDSAHNLESRIQKLESKRSKRTSNDVLVADATLELGDEARVRSKDVEALEAFHAYNELALRLGLHQATKLTPTRKSSLMARLKEHGREGWDQALKIIENSAYLQGKVKDWKVDLDFLLSPSKFLRVIEGRYTDKTVNGSGESQEERWARIAAEVEREEMRQ